MRVLFLDIDGVLCCNMQGVIEGDKVAHLRSVIDATGAKVVLSTDWRRSSRLKERAIRTLAERGIECIGETPQLEMNAHVRPREITMWHKECGASQNVQEWVAVDDRALLSEDGGAALQGHVVQTDFATGLTARLACDCIDILAPGERRAPPTLPQLTGLPALLGEASVAHLIPALETECHENCYAILDSGGRPALLAHLKACGVERLADRQAVANALGRARREGRMPGLTVPADEKESEAAILSAGRRIIHNNFHKRKDVVITIRFTRSRVDGG